MEMMQILTSEQEKEQEREKLLAQAQDSIEKEQLEAKFAVERSKAQKKIEKTLARHKQEMKKLKNGY